MDYFFNPYAFTVEFNTQLKNDLNNRKSKKAIRNHLLIHSALVIGVMNLIVGNQIRASNVDRGIILLKIVRNWTLRIINFTGTRKSLKLVRTY